MLSAGSAFSTIPYLIFPLYCRQLYALGIAEPDHPDGGRQEDQERDPGHQRRGVVGSRQLYVRGDERRHQVD